MSITRDKNRLGTAAHPLNFGDSCEIKNTMFGGRIVTEGVAKIIGATDVDDRYLVRFPNGDEVERFVPVNGFTSATNRVEEIQELWKSRDRMTEEKRQLREVLAQLLKVLDLQGNVLMRSRLVIRAQHVLDITE